MPLLLATTTPLFALILLGALAVRKGWIAHEGTVAMGRYVLAFALPALFFKTLALRPLADVIVGPFLLAYACGSLIAFAIGIAVATWSKRTAPFENALFGLGVSMSNSGYIGFALVSLLLGEAALSAVAMAILTEILIILPLSLGLLELHRHRRDHGIGAALGKVARVVGSHPLLQAIGLGLLWSAAGWPLPLALERTLDLLAGSALAVALFAVGGSLAEQRIREGLGEALAIAAGKLILHPAAVLLMLYLAPPLDPVLEQAAIILAGLPMVTIYPLLGQGYGQGERYASALLVTTALSFITLNLGIWALGLGASG